jgi:hypothetical protein
MATALGSSRNSFTSLRRYMRRGEDIELCELCGAMLAREHTHLIEPAVRKLTCSCEPCAILFTRESGKYRRIPRQVKFLPDFRMAEAQWENLMIPIGMAFFFYSSPLEKMTAMYPSPAGPTESLLSLGAWESIVQETPELKNILPDVEALLVNRIGIAQNSEPKYFIAPIDQCFKLTGLIRAHWRGLSGGTEVWDEIEKFFSGLERNSIAVKGVEGIAHA